MHLRYSYRIYPTESQRAALARTFGCARVVHNDALAARKDARKGGLPYPKSADLQKLVITAAKKTAERAWLSSVGVDPLIQSLRDLDAAYRNFFDSVSGKRAGRPVGLPRFKSKRDNRQSLRFTRNGFRIRSNGKLNLATHRPPAGQTRLDRHQRPAPAPRLPPQGGTAHDLPDRQDRGRACRAA